MNNLINFHGTRLPLDAGGGGFSWKIMREDRIDNQLVHLIDEGIDTATYLERIPPNFSVAGFIKSIMYYIFF